MSIISNPTDMADGKKKLKEEHVKPGYKTKVKTTRPGQAARMKKRGFEHVGSSASGQSKGSKAPTRAKKGGGATIQHTLKRTSVYQKKKPVEKKVKGSRPMF